MIKTFAFALALITAATPFAASAADELEVRITSNITSVDVTHNGKPITIVRNQDPKNTINPIFAQTSQKCPPFCIQRMEVAPGVKTVGELETILFLQQASTGSAVGVVDVRSDDWVSQGTIPGSTHVYWKSLDPSANKESDINKILIDKFGVVAKGKKLDFSKAKTLIFFCNSLICDQASFAIRVLLHKGYPAKKLLWYRAGMQGWETLGLTTVKEPGK